MRVDESISDVYESISSPPRALESFKFGSSVHSKVLAHKRLIVVACELISRDNWKAEKRIFDQLH